jgi:hypothetical protein
MRLFYFFMWGCTSEQPEEVVSKPAPVVEEVEPSEEVIEEEIPNQPPQIVSFKFEQSEYTQGEELRVTYETFDPEGDAVREEVFWNINGRELIAEKGKVLRKRTLKRGDKVVVTLVARDSSSNESTEAQKIIETTIKNSPPQWVRDPREIKELEGYTVQAMDPDGDPITYRLSGAPEGMSISQRGRLSYKGSTTEKGGNYTISIIAEDPEKDAVQWSFSIQLSPGSDAKR